MDSMGNMVGSIFSIRLKKKDLIFSCLYFVTLLSLLLDQIDTAVFTSVLRKIKYIYIIIMIIYFLTDVFKVNRGRVKITTATWVTLILFLHTVLFGYIFTNDIVIEATHDHALQMIIFLLFGYFTYYYIDRNCCLSLFIAVSYIACILSLAYAFITHLYEGMNIFWGIRNMFSGSNGRYRATYGFTHGGYVAYHCFVTLGLSLFLTRNIKKIGNRRNRQIWGIILLLCDSFTLMFLIMAAERSGFLSTVIVYFLYFAILYLKKKKIRFTKMLLLKTTVIIGILMVILSVSGALSYIWDNSSRSLNITINYPVFQQLGNFWTGMGYVENSGFQKATSIYGITTSSLDMYYVYIFFTTGFIGTVMIASIIFIILWKLFFNTERKYGVETLAVFCGMLFFAMWNCNFLNYRYQPGIILFVILLCGLKGQTKGKTTCENI